MTKEHLSSDLLELLALFHQHGARALVVGGEAVTYHGYARFTGDLDLFYDRSATNCGRLYAALSVFWGGDVPAVAGPRDLEEPALVVQFGRPPNRVDLLSELPGVAFEEAWAERVIDAVHLPAGDLPIAFLSLRHLLVNKQVVRRPKDLDDVEHLAEQQRRRQKSS